MLENRNLKHDLCALALAALTIFLIGSLLTYHRGDPVPQLVYPLNQFYTPDTLTWPPSDDIGNACGPWGALAADFLLTLLGVGAYYLVATLAVLDWRLLRRRPLDSLPLRAAGWILSLVGLTSLVTLLLPGFSPGPVIGTGGYLGALGGGLLQLHFALAGGVILALAALVGGLLLCSDYTLFHALAVSAGLARRRLPLPRRRAEGRIAASDLEDASEELAEITGEAAPAVRIRGKRVDDLSSPNAPSAAAPLLPPVEAEAWDEEAADDYEQFDEEDALETADDEPAEAITSVRTDPPLRIRKPHDRAAEREKMMRELEAAVREEEPGEYELPSLDLLLESDEVCFEEQAREVRRKAQILEKTFAEFGFQVRVVEIETGPVIAQYEVQLEAGLRLSKITGLADDLAIALRVPSVRIVAPIPGKNTVGIEVPNEARQVVRLREVMEEAGPKIAKMGIPLFLGKDVSGNALVADLSTLPHLLIAGRTGTGKSVCLNAIICSLLMTRRPDEVRLLMIDPKMVELSGYGSLPHLMHPVVTDMRKAEAILAWAVEKMEERYALLARAGVRHITSYNQLGEEELMERLQPENEEEQEAIPRHLPFIVIVADEMADLMMTAGKEVEQHIIRLAQKSRAVGIHLILATQKPTVDVITGLIKSNLPARIAFQVASRTDSRVVLDEMGADKLLGNGDMLFLWPGTSTLLRGQGTYLSDGEINSIVDAVSTGEQHFVRELVSLKVQEPGEAEGAIGGLPDRDDLYEQAVEVVMREGRGSVSLLQRALGIGYGRAARLVDFMAEDGIVGPYNGSQAREVAITAEQWEQMKAGGAGKEPMAVATATPPARKSLQRLTPRREIAAFEMQEKEDAFEAEDDEPWDEDE